MPPATDALPMLGPHATVRDVAVVVQHYGDWTQWADAVHVLEGILRRARPRDLIWLEANARSVLGSHCYYTTAWSVLNPATIQNLPGVAQKLATFHADGRVREAAVRSLAESGETAALPFLLLRANDWASQVAEPARAAIEDRLRSHDAGAAVALLAFENHGRALARRSVGPLFDRAREILAHPDAAGALRIALCNGDTDTRRVCAAIVASLPDDAARVPMLDVAVEDRDPVVAVVAARALLDAGGGAQLDARIERLGAHPVAIVRAEALVALARRQPERANEPLRKALFDRARCVREVAQFELPRRCGVEPRPLYVSALAIAAGRRRSVAVAGLGECGSPEDAPRVVPFLRDPASRVRLEALRALARLGADGYARELLDALSDPSSRVARASREALEKRAHLMSRDQLEALRIGGGRAARHALRLFPKVSYWAALRASLESVTIPELRGDALKVIEQLLSRQTYAPPVDRTAIEHAFAEVQDQLPTTLAAWLGEVLSLTRPR